MEKAYGVCGSIEGIEMGVDVREIASYGEREFELFYNRPRFGCHKHPVVTVCYNLDGSIAVTAPRSFKWSDRHRGLLVAMSDEEKSIIPRPSPEADDALGVPRAWREKHKDP